VPYHQPSVSGSSMLTSLPVLFITVSQSEEMVVKKTGKVQIQKQILSDSQVRNIPVGGARTEKYGSFRNSYTVMWS
jgi:hypothetical protein